MKRVLVYSVVTVALICSSCNKNAIIDKITDIKNNSNHVVLKAYYDDQSQLMKSNYTLNSLTNEYEFEWIDEDKFIAQTYDGSSTYNSSVFTATEGNKASVEFSGTIDEGYNLQEYAFYPADGSGNGFVCKNIAINPIAVGTTDPWQSTKTVTLPATINENRSYPWAHIPMIGEKDASGNYGFTPATGVIKLTIKDLPSTAIEVLVKRKSGYNAFCRDFVFDENKEIKMEYGDHGEGALSSGELHFIFTPGESTEDRTFYIPIPTGTLDAGSFNFYIKSNNIYWRQGRPKNDLTISKGEVMELPPMTYKERRDISIGGTTTLPTIIADFPSGEKFYWTIDDSSSKPGSYPLFLSNATTYTIDGQYLPMTSGTKYLHYRIINVSTSVIVQEDDIPFEYSISIPGTYYANNNSNHKIVIAESDDLTKGTYMITQCEMKGGNNPGNLILTGKIYGSVVNNTIVFSGTQVFNSYNDNYYCLHQDKNGTPKDVVFTHKGQYVGFTTSEGFGIGKATVTDGQATSYTTTSYVWSYGTSLNKQNN